MHLPKNRMNPLGAVVAGQLAGAAGSTRNQTT
jgi:hypothetical protein